MVQFASYLRCVLRKTRLIFPRTNGPIVFFELGLNDSGVGFKVCSQDESHEGLTITICNKITEKVIAVEDATYDVAKRKPEKFRLAGI